MVRVVLASDDHVYAEVVAATSDDIGLANATADKIALLASTMCRRRVGGCYRVVGNSTWDTY
jgi:hypothetical protein